MSRQPAKRARQQSAAHREENATRERLLQAKDAKDGALALSIFDEAVAAAEKGISADLCSMVLSVVSMSEQRGLSDGVKRVIAHVKQPTEAVCSNAIRALCLDDKLKDAVQVLESMGREENTRPRHRTYSPILACAGRLGDLDVARTVFVKMSEEYVNRPNEEDCSVMLRAAMASQDEPSARLALDAVLKDSEAPPTPPLASAITKWLTSVAGGSKRAVERCRVPIETSLCSNCNEKLASVELPKSELDMLISQTEKLAPTQVATKAKEWTSFMEWIDTALQSPNVPDVVVDGANVAFFKGGFAKDAHQASKSMRAVYEQVDCVVEALRAKGRRPIVFLHKRHFGRADGVSHTLERKWKDAKELYVVPHGHNDDVFWLYFTFRLGSGAVLVSNDNMKDHRFEMMHTTRAFARWRERHQAKFEVIRLPNTWDARIMMPCPHSICVQRNEASGGWHVPQELPPTEEEKARRERIEKLQALGMAELMQRYSKGSVTLEEFREARQGEMGAEMPEYMIKQYEWTCIGP